MDWSVTGGESSGEKFGLNEEEKEEPIPDTFLGEVLTSSEKSENSHSNNTHISTSKSKLNQFSVWRSTESNSDSARSSPHQIFTYLPVREQKNFKKNYAETELAILPQIEVCVRERTIDSAETLSDPGKQDECPIM